MKKFTAVAAIAAAGLAALVAVQMAGATGAPGKPAPKAASCKLAHGVKHVIYLQSTTRTSTATTPTSRPIWSRCRTC